MLWKRHPFFIPQMATFKGGNLEFALSRLVPHPLVPLITTLQPAYFAVLHLSEKGFHPEIAHGFFRCHLQSFKSYRQICNKLMNAFIVHSNSNSGKYCPPNLFSSAQLHSRSCPCSIIMSKLSFNFFWWDQGNCLIRGSLSCNRNVGMANNLRRNPP